MDIGNEHIPRLLGLCKMLEVEITGSGSRPVLIASFSN